MIRFNSQTKVAGYQLRGVDDWLCFLTDSDGNWFYFAAECDPLWCELPERFQRYALGFDRTPSKRQEREAAECIAAIGLRKAQLGHKPRPVEPEFVADCAQHFGR